MLQRNRDVAEELAAGAAQSSMSCWLRARGTVVIKEERRSEAIPPRGPTNPPCTSTSGQCSPMIHGGCSRRTRLLEDQLVLALEVGKSLTEVTRGRHVPSVGDFRV